MRYKQNRALTNVRQFFPQVKTIQDADKPLMLEITKADNENALVKSHATCALAVCAKRTAKADGVLIGTQTGYIVHGTKAVRYRLGPSISREIVSFDREAGFDVGWYKMSPPCETGRLDYDRSGKTHNETGRTVKRFRHFTTGIRTSLQKL